MRAGGSQGCESDQTQLRPWLRTTSCGGSATISTLRPALIAHLSLASLGYCVLECLQDVKTLSSTAPVEIATYAFWWTSVSATSLLFFFRIRAVYNHSRYVRGMFFALWVAVLVAPVALIFNPHLNCESESTLYSKCFAQLSGALVGIHRSLL